VIPSRRGPALSREVLANVNPASIIITDDWQAYKPLRREYIDHKIINHSGGIYVQGGRTRSGWPSTPRAPGSTWRID